MNKRHHHHNIIERKLEQLPVVDTDQLWNDMHAILDKKMPQKKERRRFIGWLLGGNGIFLLSIGLIIISSFSLFLSSKKESATVTIKKLPEAQESNKIIEDAIAKVSRENKEKITITNVSNQSNQTNIPPTISSTSDIVSVNAISFIGPQTQKQSKKYTSNDKLNYPFNEPKQVISTARENFAISPINLKPIPQDLFISTIHNKVIDSLIKKAVLTANDVKRTLRKNNENGFYAGIIGGVDLSSIRFRSAKTGSTKGFIIGYAISKKWSIESGLLWDTKRFYDNGNYFNPPGYTPSSGITIIAVNGKSRLYELPLNIKYTILPGKHSLFATTGLSSYWMRSENYDYEYLQNGQPGGHNYLSYKNETRNLFSVVNLSMGYTHKLGASGNLRIEPYLKLPIKNIGTGKMPIMSTGFNVGFTKKIK